MQRLVWELKNPNWDQCIYNVLVEDADVQGVIQKTATENLDVLPATIQLAGAEIELVPTIS